MGNQQRTCDLYAAARARVEADEQLARHADTILADWPEGDKHWQWVIEAPAQEIVDWAEDCGR